MTPRPLSPRQARSSSRPGPRGRGSIARRFVASGAAVIAALVGAMLVGAPPAAAGGPTSVLVVNYEGAKAGGALTGSKAYDDLASALDIFNPPAGESRPADSFMSSQLRLTWMIHDVTPWRIDAIYLDGTTVWVSTSVSQDGRSLFDVPSVWHQPKDPDRLINTLTSMGVLASPTGGPSAAPRAASTPSAAPAAQVGVASPAASRPTGGNPWWLTLVAAIVALGLGFAVGRARGHTRADAPSSDDRSARPDDGMPSGSAFTAAHVGGPVTPSGSDEQTRPAPVGFTPDEPPRPN